MVSKVLIVEDDAHVVRLLRLYLGHRRSSGAFGGERNRRTASGTGSPAGTWLSWT